MLSRWFFVAVACVIGLALYLGSTTRAGGDDTAALEGKPAPDISLSTIDGKNVRLADMRGKVVLVDFWATWCPPCVRSLPHLQALSSDGDLAAKGLVVWAVNAREERDVVQKYLSENKFTFTVPMDEGKAATDYKVEAIPTTVIVGRDGTIKKVFTGFGPGSEKLIDDAVKSALADR